MRVGGGQLWQAPWPVCWTRYVTLLGPRGDHKVHFALLSDPREHGSMVCTTGDGRWEYTPEELTEKFETGKWTYLGQLSDVLLAQMENQRAHAVAAPAEQENAAK